LPANTTSGAVSPAARISPCAAATSAKYVTSQPRVMRREDHAERAPHAGVAHARSVAASGCQLRMPTNAAARARRPRPGAQRTCLTEGEPFSGERPPHAIV
jgi:hypothetical protein